MPTGYQIDPLLTKFKTEHMLSNFLGDTPLAHLTIQGLCKLHTSAVSCITEHRLNTYV